jgi:nucleoside phosphorylase
MNPPHDASLSSPRSARTETPKPPVTTHSAIDIGIVIALPEEVQQLLALVPSYTRHPATNIDAYCFRRSQYHCAVILVGEMGETQAGVFTERLIGELNPSIVVSMGIAGGLNDLRPGDVHVPSQSVQYVQDSKATPSAIGSFAVLPGAPAYRVDFALLRAARAFQFDHPELFTKWTDDAAQDLAALIPDAARRQALIDAAHIRSSARLLADGHVATGPTVGAAQAFSDWIRSHNRNVKSLEMESAAVLLAAQTRTDPKRALVIRAISDFGDERKKELDANADGVLRRYSMRNAVRLLWALLDADALPLNPR